MTVLWFLQRPERSLRKPAVFVSLASCHVVVDEFFFSLFFFPVRLSDFCSFSFTLPRLANTESLHFGLMRLCVAAPSRYTVPVMCSTRIWLLTGLQTKNGLLRSQQLGLVKHIGKHTTALTLSHTHTHSRVFATAGLSTGFWLPCHFPPTCFHTRQADRSDWRGVCVQIKELNHNCMGFPVSSTGALPVAALLGPMLDSQQEVSEELL